MPKALDCPVQTSRVFVVDDHPIVVQGIQRLVESEPGLAWGGGCESTRESLSAIRLSRPDIVIQDISLRDGDGLGLIGQLRALFADLPVLVLSVLDESIYAERALRVGADGYVMKDQPGHVLLEAIHTVLRHDVYVSPSIRRHLLKSHSACATRENDYGELTDRQIQILRLIGQGLTTKEMADCIGVSPKTVEYHRLQLKERLQTRSLNDLLRRAVQWVEHLP